jgi:hypothetical protein
MRNAARNKYGITNTVEPCSSRPVASQSARARRCRSAHYIYRGAPRLIIHLYGTALFALVVTSESFVEFPVDVVAGKGWKGEDGSGRDERLILLKRDEPASRLNGEKKTQILWLKLITVTASTAILHRLRPRSFTGTYFYYFTFFLIERTEIAFPSVPYTWSSSRKLKFKTNEFNTNSFTYCVLGYNAIPFVLYEYTITQIFIQHCVVSIPSFYPRTNHVQRPFVKMSDFTRWTTFNSNIIKTALWR